MNLIYSKKVTIVLSVLIGLSQFMISQTWVSTDLTANDAFAISDIASHQGNLYATYNTGITGEFAKSSNDGASWNTPTATNVQGFKVFVLSAGDRLYLASLYNFDYYLYYSTDGGDTFTEDMNGLPSGIFGGVATITSLQVLNDNIIVGMGGNGYYFKPLSNPSTDFENFDTPTLLNAGTDPVGFYNGKLYTYDNSGAFTFYSSTNFGTTWSTPSANNLPNDLVSEQLAINSSNGRIYLSGTSSSDTVYGLYYSDDEGENWSQMDLSMVSATNYLGDFHKITALYVQGELFYVAFDNDIDESYPDVIKSEAISTTAPIVDVTGLPDNAPGNVHGTKFLVHNNKPILALNIIDVYVKDQALSVSDFDTQQDISLYPTVVQDYLNILTATPYTLSIFDVTGKLLKLKKVRETPTQIDLSTLKSGVYLVKIDTVSGFEVRKIIKK